MLGGRRILAVVPARSGSKGIPDKNLQRLQGKSLIARAGECLQQLTWLDRAVISTDSSRYASEACRRGLEAPFLRPAHLAADDTSAIDTLQHAVAACEQHYDEYYDVVLIIEPTSPLRKPEDLTACAETLVDSGADSVVSVSEADTKYHPSKLLTLQNDALRYYANDGAAITARQQLKGDLYFRNGICYAITRDCVMHQGLIISENTRAHVVRRPVANIDTTLDLEWAAFLLRRQG